MTHNFNIGFCAVCVLGEIMFLALFHCLQLIYQIIEVFFFFFTVVANKLWTMNKHETLHPHSDSSESVKIKMIFAGSGPMNEILLRPQHNLGLAPPLRLSVLQMIVGSFELMSWKMFCFNGHY